MDSEGKSFGDELRRIGWVGEEEVGSRDMHAMFELHIEHSNSVVKELVQENGNGKVLFINHTGSELCSMVGDQCSYYPRLP